MNSRSIYQSFCLALLLAGLTGAPVTHLMLLPHRKSTVTSGVWKITYFYDTDKERPPISMGMNSPSEKAH